MAMPQTIEAVRHPYANGLGPAISAIPFVDVDEIIRRGNATTFGLGSGVWTRDVSKAH